MVALADDIRVIDADTHYTEPPDLWTKRAPAAYKDRVLHIEDIDGQPTWVVDGAQLGFARGGGVVDREGGKAPFLDSMAWGLDRVHQAAWDPKLRLQIMDECGVHAQVLFPNAVGLGGQTVNTVVQDPVLRMLCIELYNDAMAEIQEESGNRLLPMPVMPAWDVDACVKEVERVASLGLRGVNMTSDPQDLGSPDLANRAWDPFWEACADLQLPVHFHIGSSNTAMDFFGRYFWPSQDEYVKPAIGGSMLFINSSRVLINTIYAGIFDRFPKLRMVAVESGIGWIPFMLETMDYEIWENAPQQAAELSKMPSKYFHDHWHATFWFEKNGGDVQYLLDKVGEDNVLFETDFPHPTCLYPAPLETMAEKMNALRPETRRKVMGDNAAQLYRL
ncbi:MAG TPA: amidohydrolase family protein [Acidimicrobiales bacterium]|nr:amidohydrolase family protein [Acidimicrobiales bacterium]